MHVIRERSDLHDEVAFYLENILGNLFALLLPISYIWLLWTLRPFGQSPDYVWVPLTFLFGTLILVHRLGNQNAPIAMLILVWGLFFTITSAALVYQIPEINLFLLGPLVLALSLLSTRVIVSMIISTFISLVLNTLSAGITFGEFVFTAAFIGLMIAVVGLSAHYLHGVLKVVWNRHTELDRMIALARERGSELRRMVKQLDESNERFLQMNRKLELAMHEAREARQMKQQFAQNITHELRTPLNLIVGFIELMTQSSGHYGEPLPYAYLRDLDIVYNNARHLQALIDDILDISRIEAAQMSVNPTSTDFEAMLHEAVETIRGLVESKGLYLRLEIDGPLPEVDVDQTRIKQVLFNLINNAARFTRVGGITIYCTVHEGDILCRVSDTGAGIEAEHLDRIFDVFHQAGSQQQGGTGLGLAISKRFIEIHSGRIWVESEMGQGSNFSFTVPLPKAELVQSVSPQIISSAPISAVDQRRLLFAITRSQSAVSMLNRYLPDCTVVPIVDPERLDQVARTHVPHAILIDSNLQEHFSADDTALLQWPDIPVITCPLGGEEQQRRQLDVDALLMKPVSTEQVRQLLRQFGSEVDTVMVIDDNRDFVGFIARILDHPLRRYRVIRAFSAQEGLKLLEINRPDLILLDLEMDGMSGMDFIHAVRNRNDTRNLPIAVITGYEEEQSHLRLSGNFCVQSRTGMQAHEIIRWTRAVLNI